MKNNEINELFDLLDRWRLFPAYQLERRADIYFALYLPQILEEELGEQSILKIIPEFPVRIGTIYPKIPINRSFKIDYLVITTEKVYLIELKTDNYSRRKKQDEYLEKSAKVNISELLNGLIQIFEATNSKNKYYRLLKEFEEINWVKEKDSTWKNISQDKKIEIIYIQPKETDTDKDKKIITFDEIALKLEKRRTPISMRFSKSLRQWTNNSNLA